MSYLLQYTRRPKSTRRRSQNARVDERLRLNRPDFDGGAEVRAFVEDTSAKRWRRRPPSPRLKLRISDCVNQINLEFAIESAELRDNSLYKIETLLAALGRFRAALIAEAELYAVRERHPT